MVFIYHNLKYWRNGLHPELSRLFHEFHLGVAMFFVLSGFLIAHTYNDKPMRSPGSYTRYMAQRLARIMPLYWLILTAYYLDPEFGKGGYTWLTYSLCHGFSDLHNLDGIAQAWSLTVEMTFYFFAPLLCLLQRKHLLYVTGFLIALFFLAWGVGQAWYLVNFNMELFFYPLQFIITGTFMGHCLEFLAGMLLADILRKPAVEQLKKIPYKTWIGFLGMLLTAYAIGSFQLNISEHGNQHLGGLLIQVFLFPVFVFFALSGLIFERTWLQRFLGSKPMVLLGNASFAFYLVHISYVNMRIKTWFFLPDNNFVVLWIVAIILYLCFEKPIYDWCRKWLKRKNHIGA